MSLRLYNTLNRKLEEFRPQHPPHVGVYSCGPTVYWNQHIGHMYAYVHWDVLVRYLRYLGYSVKWVMNITDVGHLTGDNLGDADTGEDRMEKGAKREGLTVGQIAEKYIAQFRESLKLLNIAVPDVLCRATEHITDQIALAKKIEANGLAYRTATGLVFDTAQFPDYARFARLDLAAQRAGARVAVDAEKKNPWDFLLWVTNQPEHVLQWDSPWGRGFPGWHLECTAMSTKYLGETFDIHTGGKEHIPIHHTNEIAQAFGSLGRQTANYWLHNEWLTVKDEKMSKSLGNFYTIQDLVAKGYDPLSLRYLILNSHYRTGLNFSFEALDGAQKALGKLRERLGGDQAVRQSGGASGRSDLSEGQTFKEKEWGAEFERALDDDLNTPKALAVVWGLVEDKGLPPMAQWAILERWEKILGIRLGEPWAEVVAVVPETVGKLLQERARARQEGDFSRADALREEIESLGFVIEDTAAGPKVKTAPRQA